MTKFNYRRVLANVRSHLDYSEVCLFPGPPPGHLLCKDNYAYYTAGLHEDWANYERTDRP